MFLRPAEAAGLDWTEWVRTDGDGEEEWKGTMEIRGTGLDREGLRRRKGMVKLWIGRWSENVLGLERPV